MIVTGSYRAVVAGDSDGSGPPGPPQRRLLGPQPLRSHRGLADPCENGADRTAIRDSAFL